MTTPAIVDNWVQIESTEPKMGGFWDLVKIKDEPLSKKLAVKSIVSYLI